MASTLRLCLAALVLRAGANPVPTPPPLGTDDCLSAPAAGHHQQIPGAGPGCAAAAPNCTFTTVITVSPLPIVGAPTRTIFNSTATSTSHLDCKGCTALAVSTIDFLNPGPAVNVTTTVTATTPSAVTTFVCLRSPSVSTGSPPHMTPAPHMGPAVVADEGPEWTSITPPRPPPFPTNPRSVTSTVNLPPVFPPPPPPPFVPRD